jgi:hypothetical protein
MNRSGWRYSGAERASVAENPAVTMMLFNRAVCRMFAVDVFQLSGYMDVKGGLRRAFGVPFRAVVTSRPETTHAVGHLAYSAGFASNLALQPFEQK